jgi:hypothetical protein
MFTFSQGLIIFSTTLTLVFFVLFFFAQRLKSKSETISSKLRLDIAIFCLLIIESSTIILLQIPSFKSSLIYLIALPLIAGVLLCTLRWSSEFGKSRQLLILGSAIMFHAAILYFPASGMEIGERTYSIARLTIDGHWDPNWNFLNPTYGPYPMDVSIFSTISIVTNISYISQLIDWAYYLPLVIAFDLILYTLTKRVTSSAIAGVLAIFLLSSLPTANLLLHASKWTGSLLVLISALALIKASEKKIPYAYIIIANLSYAAAIFFHPSAAIGAFLPVGIVLIGYVVSRAVKTVSWSSFLKSRLFISASVLLVIITLSRAIYTEGYSETVFPAMKNFVTGIFSVSTPSEELAPVYEYAVNPINAYAWCIPIALSTALALFVLFRKRLVGGLFTLILYFVGAFFALTGLLSAVFGAGGFQGAMYPAFVFFLPAAAILGVKALKSAKLLSGFFVILLLMYTGIALTDPMLSKEQYSKIGAGNIAPIKKIT